MILKFAGDEECMLSTGVDGGASGAGGGRGASEPIELNKAKMLLTLDLDLPFRFRSGPDEATMRVTVKDEMDLLAFGTVLDGAFGGRSTNFVVGVDRGVFREGRKRQLGGGGGVGTRWLLIVSLFDLEPV